MKIIVKKPNSKLTVENVENSVEKIQQIVGGYFEPVNVSENCMMLCNEDGKRKKLPYNFDLGNQIIVGDVVFVQTGNGDFTDLDDANIEMILHFFSRTPYQS